MISAHKVTKKTSKVKSLSSHKALRASSEAVPRPSRRPEAEREAQGRKAKADPKGMCYSNTYPSNNNIIYDPYSNLCKIKGFLPIDHKLLSFGLDTVSISYQIEETKHEFYEQIQLSKLEAQKLRKDVLVRLYTGPTNHYLLFELKPFSSGHYAFNLHNEYFRLSIWAEGASGNRPRVKVIVNSRTLHEIGLSEARHIIEKALGDVLGVINIHTSGYSRIDLYSDIIIDKSVVSLNLLDKIICRSVKRVPYLNGDVLETLYVGDLKAPVKCRIYDKIIDAHSKGSLPDYLERNNLEALGTNQRVYRVEFELHTEALKEHSCRALSSMPDSAPALHKYLTEKWLRISSRSVSTNTNKEKNTPWWDTIAGSFGGQVLPFKKKKATGWKSPDIDRQKQKVLRELAEWGGMMQTINPSMGNRFLDVHILFRDTVHYEERKPGATFEDFGLMVNDAYERRRNPEGLDIRFLGSDGKDIRGDEFGVALKYLSEEEIQARDEEENQDLLLENEG